MHGYGQGCVVASGGTPSRYDDANFVNHFVMRQFGDAVEIPPTSRCSGTQKTVKSFQFNLGTEPFYSTIVSLLKQIVGPDSRCVDIGCGPGRITAAMARLSAEHVIGIDRSDLMVDFAKAIVSGPVGSCVELHLGNTRGFLPALGFSNCAFVVGDAQQLPLDDASMDVAVLSNVLHRVGEPLKVLSELHRALRPGGRTVLSNSYDWAELITARALWFDDVKDVVHRSEWNIDFELDYVPYWSPVSTRKSTVAYNHVVLLTKR
jgi:SAM-dependent methyltransferase